jgi:translation initiation factor 2-alpha kinase 3
MSPEQQNSTNYNHKVDIYAMGMILFELLYPFKTEMERSKTLTGLRNLNFQHEKPEMSLVRSMLSHNPEQRPEVTEILKKMSKEQPTKTSPNKKEVNSI